MKDPEDDIDQMDPTCSSSFHLNSTFGWLGYHVDLDEGVEGPEDDIFRTDGDVVDLANDVGRTMFLHSPRNTSSSDHGSTRVWVTGDTRSEEGGVGLTEDDFAETMFP